MLSATDGICCDGNEYEKVNNNMISEHHLKRKLSLKERVTRYKVNRKPLKGSVCLLGIIALLVVLSGISFMRLQRVGADFTGLQAQRLNVDGTVFTAAFVGDVMLGRSMESAARFYGYDEYFKYTKGFFEGFDITFCNFEHPLIDENETYAPLKKELLLSATKQCLPALKAAGFNLIGLANNHIVDYGPQAVAYTTQALDEADLSYIGVGLKEKERVTYGIHEYNGLKIATVAVTTVLNGRVTFSDDQEDILAKYRNAHYYIEAVSEAREKADIVIVFAHWGDEFTTIITEKQHEMARDLIDAGADVIIGSHPHTVQPVEIYNGKIIFYSLGNFISDQGLNRTKDSIILRMYLDASGGCLFEAIPLRISNASPVETGNPVFVRRIFHALTEHIDAAHYKVDGNRLYFSLPGFFTY